MASGLLMAVLVSACAGRADAPAHHGDRTSILTVLCASQRAAASGRLIEARTIFDDQVHESLHVLAADGAVVDRAVSARLLEAKQVVEARFAQLDPVVADALGALVAPVVDALGAIGATGPDGCEEQGE